LRFIGIYCIIILQYIWGYNMRATYEILQNLLKCNKGMKLVFRENSNILDIYLYNDIVLTLELNNYSIENNSDIIYNSIIKLSNITMYIPKIYMK
jgi:hypothetical protein